MVLEAIYIVRHGFRLNWDVNPSTGKYHANIPSPTGIAADPVLSAHGVEQATQLGQHLMQLDPPVDLIYSSPFYRCLQTLKPFTTALAAQKPIRINVEPGVGEFYGTARFDHPSPAPISELQRHFDHLHAPERPSIVPSTKGESIPQLHDRVAYALKHLIEEADKNPDGPKTLLICTHAAVMIAIGRVLTGRMPEDENEEDFKCFTCGFSKFVQRKKPVLESITNGHHIDMTWSPTKPEAIPDISWREGNGVAGGWDCEINCDCSFLKDGEERGWCFEMENSMAGKKTGGDL